jgi:predicted nucleic acid-binding protein
VKIIVNDANILIDLVELQILSSFFQLDFEFHTTEIILEELFEEQKEELNPYILSGKMTVNELNGDDFISIYEIRQQKPKLSEQDCSAFHQAEKENATLITSDNTLRKFAKEKSIEVHGHLWVFDMMVSQNTITPILASQKLLQLCEEVNPKLGLPKTECEKRFGLWKY